VAVVGRVVGSDCSAGRFFRTGMLCREGEGGAVAASQMQQRNAWQRAGCTARGRGLYTQGEHSPMVLQPIDKRVACVPCTPGAGCGSGTD
jgi:hypothetical protein